MPISFSTFTNPIALDRLDNPPHAQQHADANDAIGRLEDALVGSPWINVKDRAFGAVGDGTTDDRSAIFAADQDATSQRVLVPPGTYLISSVISLTGNKAVWQGAGKWISGFKTSGSVLFNGSFSSLLDEVEFRDLFFDADGVASVLFAFNANTSIRRLIFRDCRFTNLKLSADAIRVAGNVDLYLLGHTIFHNPAAHAGWGRAVLAQAGAKVHWGDETESLWLSQSAAFDTGTGTGTDEQITENHYVSGYHDQFWPYIPASMSGSGGAVTYAATNVIDIGANFTSLAPAAYPTVVLLRAMPVRETGTVTTASDRALIDSAATFVANGVIRGDLVRVSGKFGIVESVESETVLNLRWFDNTTLLPTSRPAAATSYTVYGIIYGYATSKTGTTQLNVPYWTNLFGTRTTPSAGDLYEVMQTRPSQILAPEPGTRGITIPPGARFFRGWADMAGTMSARSVIYGHFKDGQDYGITLGGDNCKVEALVQHCGAGAVFCDGDEAIIGGQFIGNCWNFASTAALPASVTINNASKCKVVPGTLISKTTEGTQEEYGVKLTGTGSSNKVLDVEFVGHSTARDINIGSTLQSGVVVRGTAQLFSSAGTGSALVDVYSTGSPENNVIGSPGSIYHRTDGGTTSALYVKELGTGTTGWIAK